MGDTSARSKRRLLVLALACQALGCVYPVRSTSLSPVPVALATSGAPAGVWRLRLIGAQVVERKHSSLAWDDDGSGPDLYARLYLGEQLAWESPAVLDDVNPHWAIVLPKNLRIGPQTAWRLELWDRDGGVSSDDPAGAYTRRGLPAGLGPDGSAELRLGDGTTLSISLEPPTALLGMGIDEFEDRGTSFVVVEVEPFSPAGRAGIAAGDAIVEIGGKSIESLGAATAVGLLSQAAERGLTLGVQRRDGLLRRIKPTTRFVWPSL